MIPFTETLRHDHPLSADDWILEIGAHMGYDSKILAEKYGCAVVAYEPIAEFYGTLAGRFLLSPWAHLVHPVNAGAGATKRREMFGVQGDRSGIACAGNHKESVIIIPIADILNGWTTEFRRSPALVQINAEGAEYEILDSLVASGLISTLPRIQVQFHSVVPESRVRRAMIYEQLARTHDFMWAPGEFDTGWVGWKIR